MSIHLCRITLHALHTVSGIAREQMAAKIKKKFGGGGIVFFTFIKTIFGHRFIYILGIDTNVEITIAPCKHKYRFE